MHDTLSYIDYNVPESLLLYARSQDRVQFSPRQEIEDWETRGCPVDGTMQRVQGSVTIMDGL